MKAGLHHWQGLDTDHQAPRYFTIAAMCRGAVLDVGCGSGLLAGLVPEWTGIEPQCEAVAQIKPEVIVHLCKAEDFDPNGQTWDTIVFNESLYYCARPLAMLSRYREMLSPGGSLLISIFQRPTVGWRRWFTRSNVDVACAVDVWAIAQNAAIIREDIPQAGTFSWRLWKITFP